MKVQLMPDELLSFSLAGLTSWGIGGKAHRFYRPVDALALMNYIKLLPPQTPLVWLGLGSNVLIRDGGIQGAVICTRSLQKLTQPEPGRIIAEAGVTCAKLARFGCKAGANEAAFFAGIPGTVGGALAMNAGAFGGETWEWVENVTVMNAQGECFTRSPQDYDISYRTVKGKQACQSQEAFMSAVFRFPIGNEKIGMEKIQALLRTRKQTQPIGTLNCGSVYRNPPGEFAAKLIEACALKGHRIGNAFISPKHANFIINGGGATSRDIEALMATIENCVLTKFGISLHPEVRILGQRSEEQWEI